MSPALWQIMQITQVTSGTMFDVAAVDAHRIYETEVSVSQYKAQVHCSR